MGGGTAWPLNVLCNRSWAKNDKRPLRFQSDR